MPTKKKMADTLVLSDHAVRAIERRLGCVLPQRMRRMPNEHALDAMERRAPFDPLTEAVYAPVEPVDD